MMVHTSPRAAKWRIGGWPGIECRAGSDKAFITALVISNDVHHWPLPCRAPGSVGTPAHVRGAGPGCRHRRARAGASRNRSAAAPLRRRLRVTGVAHGAGEPGRRAVHLRRTAHRLATGELGIRPANPAERNALREQLEQARRDNVAKQRERIQDANRRLAELGLPPVGSRVTVNWGSGPAGEVTLHDLTQDGQRRRHLGPPAGQQSRTGGAPGRRGRPDHGDSADIDRHCSLCNHLRLSLSCGRWNNHRDP